MVLPPPSQNRCGSLADADVVQLVERSAFFHERIRQGFRPSHDQGDLTAGKRRVTQWCQRLTGGDTQRFRRRLDWDGISQSRLEKVAGGVRLVDPSALPRWAYLLTAVLRRQALTAPGLEEIESSQPLLRAGPALPFEHILISFVEEGTARVERVAPHHWRSLAPQARGALQRNLLSGLSAIAQDTLRVEFEVWLALHRSPPANSFHPPDNPPARSQYGRFVHAMRAGELACVFKRYPVLARMLAEQTGNWVASCTEFLGRLERDTQSLADAFGGGQVLGQVVDLRPGLSDPHDHGRSVIEVRFENGLNCVYKPHNIDSERRFHLLLQTVNRSGGLLELPGVRSMCRPSHGWSETVQRIPCQTTDQVERFYRRAGMLLCLLFVLEGSDCHCGNIVAHGEFPFVIDLETLFAAAVPPTAFGSGGSSLHKSSVLRTGILPHWVGERDQVCNQGALSGGAGRGLATVRLWKDVNTDSMRMVEKRVPLSAQLSDVQFQGRIVSASEYASEVLAGFEEMYRNLRACSGALLSDSCAPLHEDKLRTRFLLRNTSLYAKVLENCRQPQCLGDGMDVTIEIDLLCSRFLATAGKPVIWPLIQAEHHALSSGDVPRFLYDAGLRSVCDGSGQKLLQLDLRPGTETARERLDGLSDDQMAQQTGYVRLALNALHGGPSEASPAADRSERDGRGEFLQEALAIGEIIEASGTATPDGGRVWLARACRPEADIWQIEPMTLRMYDGICGVGLFLAALERLTGGDGSRALAAFRPLTGERGRADTNDFLRAAPVGAGTGAGSVVYALARAGWLLGNQGLITVAEDFARPVDKRRLALDREYDLVRGSAGFLLALLTLYQLRPLPWILDRAFECGDHLLKSRHVTRGGARAWKTVKGEVLCGFSHGIAGIGYALRRLSLVAGESRYLDAALEAETYEDSLYSETHGNWPDQLARESETHRHSRNAWCHGAGGIVLARIAAQTAALQSDSPARRALDWLLARPLAPLDHVCCGNGGIVETLLAAGRRTGDNQFVSAARDLAQRMAARAKQTGTYCLGHPAGFRNVSFHQGLAGIGYQMLRLHRPHEVPSALLWA